MPVGPSAKSYPTLGYAGWAMFKDSGEKDAAWKLMAHLLTPAANLEWAKVVGVLPIHDGADQDPFFGSESYKGWFEQLKRPETYEFVTIPSHLENMGSFYDNIAVKGFQQVLLGQRTAKDVADEWAKYLTEQQQAWLAKNKG
jgi:multiple sugar transport system substrate-binding protein